MDKENQTDLNSHGEHDCNSKPSNDEHIMAKFTRKKRIVILVILASLLGCGIYIYLNQGPDPTTWESLINDYKNTK